MRGAAIALLLTGCGAAAQPLAGTTAVVEPSGPLPEGAVFAASVDLEGDLLAVFVSNGARFPGPDGAWAGSVMVYRRAADGWALEGELDAGASWAIGARVHVFEGRVALVAPYDGRCVGAAGQPAPQSGSVYVFGEGEWGWGLEALVCAPTPLGNLSFGAASAAAGSELVVATRGGPGREREPDHVYRVLKTPDGWMALRVHSIPRGALLVDVSAEAARTAWVNSVRGPRFDIGLRSFAHPRDEPERVPCPDPSAPCRVRVLQEALLLLPSGAPPELRADNGARTPLDLVGAGDIQRAVSHGRRVALLDDDGQVFLMNAEAPDGPVSARDELSALCPEGVRSLALDDAGLALACAGEARVVIVPFASR